MYKANASINKHSEILHEQYTFPTGLYYFMKPSKHTSISELLKTRYYPLIREKRTNLMKFKLYS